MGILGKKKKVTIGHKYYLGMHLVLCHGPIDSLRRITIDERVAWVGEATGGRFKISAEGLFGGERSEGGVSGEIDFEQGHAEQPANDYLKAQLGETIPAFRGVAALVLRQCYMGTSPYLKKWAFRAQRIFTRSTGLQQWYAEKACIKSSVGTQPTMVIPDLSIDARHAGAGQASGIVISGMSKNDIAVITKPDGLTYKAWSAWPRDDATSPPPPIPGKVWLNRFQVTTESGTSQYLTDWFSNAEEAFQGVQSVLPIHLSGHDKYTIWINDPNPPDNRGGFSIRVEIFQTQSDMNPAHILRECLTDPDWGMGYPETSIDEISFRLAADALYAEKMGISLLWDRQSKLEDFIQEIIAHINAILYVDRMTGLFVLKLIRDDYKRDQLLILGENEIESVEDYARPAIGELINAVTVNYWSAETGKSASITIQDPALVQLQGGEIGTTIQYPGFTNATIATRVAQRDLQSLSTPLLSCTIYADRTASQLNVGDVFLFDWPEYHKKPIIMRVTGIALGDGRTNKVRINCIEDMFSLPTRTTVTPDAGDGWTDPSQAPQHLKYTLVYEAPYFELVQQYGKEAVDAALSAMPETTNIAVAAVKSGNALNATLYSDAGTGYKETAAIEFCPSCILKTDVGRLDTLWSVSHATDMDLAEPGTWAQIGSEIVEFVKNGNGEIQVRRGLFDTLPAPHAAGSRLYIWDSSDLDETPYKAGTTINVKLIPNNNLGQPELEAIAPQAIKITGRAARPYPPGNLKINDLYWPINLVGELKLTWAHRNRLQQASTPHIAFDDSDVQPEPGTTYTVKIYDGNNILKHIENGIVDNHWTYPLAAEAVDFNETPTLPAGAEISLLLPLSGEANATTFPDLSFPPKLITRYGNTHISTGAQLFGENAAYFDGIKDSLQSQSNAAFALGGKDFTFECWLYPQQTSSPYPTVIDRGGSWQWNEWSITVNHTSAKNVYALWVFNHSSSRPALLSSSKINYDQWVHLAITRQGNTWRLFINGILEHTIASTASITDATSAPLRIGNNYKGFVRELRLTKGLARYSNNFTLPVSPYHNDSNPNTDIPTYASMSLLLPLSGAANATTFTDLSTPPKSVKRYGNTHINTNALLFGKGSAYFDNNVNYLAIESTPDLALGADDFTIELWLYPEQNSYSWPQPLMRTGRWVKDEWTLGVNHIEAPGRYSVFVYNASSGPLLRSTSTITYNQWVHLAITRQGTVWKLFVNGVLENSATSAAMLTGSSNEPLLIGQSYKGFMRELRITKGLARYSNNFTVPTEPYQNDNSTINKEPETDSHKNKLRRIVLESVRDGLTSHQHYDHTFKRP